MGSPTKGRPAAMRLRRARVDETAIYHKTGFSCPDGGSGDLIAAHICPDCFRDKLLPWPYSQDAIIHNQKWDW